MPNKIIVFICKIPIAARLETAQIILQERLWDLLCIFLSKQTKQMILDLLENNAITK